MVIELYQKLEQGGQARQTLAALREALREDKGARGELVAYCDGDFDALTKCFSAEDAKTRKNAALLAGELAIPVLDELWMTYRTEQTRFVRSAYLMAIKHYNYIELLPQIKKALEEVNAISITEENRKHLQEERKLLRELIVAKEHAKWHRYTGESLVSDLVLTTNRNHQSLLYSELGRCKKKEFGAGIMVRTDKPGKLFALRTFEEMFFVLPGAQRLPGDPQAAAETLLKAGLVRYLRERHEESSAPFLFRIEVRGTMPLEKRGNFVRRCAAVLEEGAGGALANTTDGYEFELRLIETKEGEWYALLKLFTLRDTRFAYRQKTIAAGMRPVNAALCMALANTWGKEEKFFQEGARVLDPFCGAGTMLIERAKCAPVKEIFGIDLLEQAVDAARFNTKLADLNANYINRDFFTFTSEILFSEIVTDMPFTTSKEEEKEREIEKLYQRFFLRAPELLKPDGVMLILTHNRPLMYRYAKNFSCLKEFELSKKEGSYLFLLRQISGEN